MAILGLKLGIIEAYIRCADDEMDLVIFVLRVYIICLSNLNEV